MSNFDDISAALRFLRNNGHMAAAKELEARLDELTILRHKIAVAAQLEEDARYHDPTVERPAYHRLVPLEPTDEMIDAGRTAVMARDCSSERWTPRDHYEHTSEGELHLAVSPKDLLDSKGIMSKAGGALLVWYAMVGAAPSTVDKND